jgi:uncharacterized SAM-binding protein YcdF (DUF218 family)
MVSNRSTARRVILVIAGLATILAVAMVAVAWCGLRDNPGHADAALVPGNKVEPDGTPSARLQARLDRTAELYREGWFPLIIVSGGTGKEGYDEAAVMRDYLVKHGIPEGQIITDNQGVTSYASARNTADILKKRGLRSIFVVSQYFHVPRMRLALKRFGIPQIYASHARFFEWRDFYSTFREVIGCGSYMFRRYEMPVENRDAKS